ncbi:unnamed protein product [Pleuronectes platessa]|uniref:Uncharacterized protein n=1 Tax=Pleuronectes platessa TaxID=8262 RepID=A0A9N7YP72_PLEPL|nr:unnamed protein product [Pleuronectes platessa]
MRVDIPKDNPNMLCQAVPLQSQSMLSNHLDHDPPSRPDATPVLSHRPPPPTRTHHEPPPRSWSTAHAQCQRDTGSATSTTISPHDSESATLDPTPRSTNRNPWCGHRGPGSAGDKAKGFRGRGIGMEKRKEKLEREAPCVMCNKIYKQRGLMAESSGSYSTFRDFRDDK